MKTSEKCKLTLVYSSDIPCIDCVFMLYTALDFISEIMLYLDIPQGSTLEWEIESRGKGSGAFLIASAKKCADHREIADQEYYALFSIKDMLPHRCIFVDEPPTATFFDFVPTTVIKPKFEEREVIQAIILTKLM